MHKLIQLKSVLQVKCDEMSNESPNPRCFFFSDVFPRSDRRRSSYSPDGWMKTEDQPHLKQSDATPPQNALIFEER